MDLGTSVEADQLTCGNQMDVDSLGRTCTIATLSDAGSDTAEELRFEKPADAQAAPSVAEVLAACSAVPLPLGASVLDHALHLIQEQVPICCLSCHHLIQIPTLGWTTSIHLCI